MNLLTGNRILEAGDEYRDNGAWKPIPAPDIGLQVMFTNYKEVRRPKEISPDSEKPRIVGGVAETTATHGATIVTAKAGKETSTPAPTPSGAGGILPIDTYLSSLREKSGMAPLDVHIPYPTMGAGAMLDPCQWIGRNGTFYAKALNLHHNGAGKVRMVPHGKRGEARNAMIEFPVEIIPQLIDWLNQHKP